jgi:hypothetical protein
MLTVRTKTKHTTFDVHQLNGVYTNLDKLSFSFKNLGNRLHSANLVFSAREYKINEPWPKVMSKLLALQAEQP